MLGALKDAWSRVRANGGGAGPDGITLAAFQHKLEPQLAVLARELRSDGYRPGGSRRVRVAKSGGGERVLSIPDIRDRIAQTAVAQLLSRRLDGRMADGSYGYRPARGVAEAIAALTVARKGGGIWTFDADIRGFFDEASHAVLMSDLSIWVEERDLLRVIGRWLDTFGESARGLAQGSPISPVLANLYLHPFDREMDRLGYRLIRYADDFVAPTRSREQALAAWRAAAAILRRRRLTLHPAKTGVSAPHEPFVFLGKTLSPVRAPERRRRT
jgi:group II intron reverse transcriptase/maturase